MTAKLIWLIFPSWPIIGPGNCMKRHLQKYHLLITTLFLFVLPVYSEAAVFSLSSPVRNIEMNGIVEVLVNLDSKGDNINAVEGKILVPKELKALDISDGNSIINFWVERPRIADGSIVWSGIIPGGYTGTNGFLFSMTFLGVKSGRAELSFSNASALLNDSKGTKVSVTTKAYTLYVEGEQTTTAEESPPPDTDIPESFTPLLSKDPNLFDGKYFIVFATQDKLSGIDHYEVAENIGFKSFTYRNLPFAVAESPYVLADQTLRSNIYVKAVDKQGNARVETIFPLHQSLIYNYDLIFAILLVLAIFLSYGTHRAYALHTKSVRKKSQPTS